MFISITSYEDKERLKNQFKNLYSKENYYVIHWNKVDKKKNKNHYYDLKRFFSNYSNVYFFSKYKIFWGHYSILKIQYHMIKLFLKSNENVMINLDAKTLNLYDINLISNKIQNLINDGYNFFNFNFDWFKNDKNFNDIKINDENNFYRKKVYYKTLSRKDNKYYRFYRLLCYLYEIFTDYNVFKKNINFFKIKANYKWWLNYHYIDREPYYNTWILSNKLSKIPKKIKDWKFQYKNIVSKFFILDKDNAMNIFVKNKKYVKILAKFLKNKPIPEEIFIHTLYYNLILNKEKSINTISYLDDETKESFDNWYEIYNKENKEYIFFIRRINNINTLEKIKEKMVMY